MSTHFDDVEIEQLSELVDAIGDQSSPHKGGSQPESTLLAFLLNVDFAVTSAPSSLRILVNQSNFKGSDQFQFDKGRIC